MRKQVSIVIPTYNRAGVVLDAVQSALRQPGVEAEVIVVDDGSTDDTERMVRAFAAGFPPGGIRYLYQPNGGPAHARNTGIRAATAPYIAFLDADDLWLPNKLAGRVDFLDRHPEVAFLFSDMLQFQGRRIVSRSYFREKKGYDELVRQRDYLPHAFDLLIRENFVPLPTVVLRRACLEKVGLFDESLRCAEDWDLWLRLAAEYKVGVTPDVMLKRRLSGDNISHNWFVTASCGIRVLEKVRRDRPALYRRNAARIRYKLSAFQGAVGYIYFARNDIASARAHLWRSVRNKPNFKSLRYLVLSFLGERCLTGLRTLKHRFSVG